MLRKRVIFPLVLLILLGASFFLWYEWQKKHAKEFVEISTQKVSENKDTQHASYPEDTSVSLTPPTVEEPTADPSTTPISEPAPAPDPTQEATSTEAPVSADALPIIEKKEEATDNDATIHVLYPQIEQLPNEAMKDKVNTLLAKRAKKYYKDSLSKAKKGTEKILSDSSYEVKYNQKEVLSVLYNETSGSDKSLPTVEKYSVTIDTATGKEVKLSELLSGIPKYKSIINKIVQEELKSKSSGKPFKTIEKNQSFYLSEENVIIYFQSNEYTVDPAEVSIPFSAFKE